MKAKYIKKIMEIYNGFRNEPGLGERPQENVQKVAKEYNEEESQHVSCNDCQCYSSCLAILRHHHIESGIACMVLPKEMIHVLGFPFFFTWENISNVQSKFKDYDVKHMKQDCKKNCCMRERG